MSRQKEYDRDDVLTNAMQVFWRRGYEGTSMQDLVDATGLNRFGMYQAFGSKEGLFHATLDKYCNDMVTQATAGLYAPPQDLNSIRAYFDLIGSHRPSPAVPPGCLMTNTAIDLEARDNDAAKKVKGYFDRIETGFRLCLTGARDKGQIAADADVDRLARFLLGVTQAMAVFDRAKASGEHLQSMVETAMAAIPISE